MFAQINRKWRHAKVKLILCRGGSKFSHVDEEKAESTWWFYDCWIIQLFGKGGDRFKKVIVVHKKLSKFYKNTAFVHSRMAEFEVSVEPLSGEGKFVTFSWPNMVDHGWTQHVCTLVVRAFHFGFIFTFLYSLKWTNLSFGNRCVYSGENDGQAGKGILAEQIAKLEKKVESQGDEIALLKSALADALRRLKSLEEQKAIVGKFNEAIT